MTRRLLSLLILASALFGVGTATACERHLKGHSGGSDAGLESSRP